MMQEKLSSTATKRSLAIELPSLIGRKVRVRGWLHTLRPLGKINFLLLRDRSDFIQIVITEKNLLKELSKLQPGSVLTVMGEVAASSEAALKAEIIHPVVTIEVAIHEVPKVDYYKPTIQSDLDHILDHRAMALRNQKLQAIFKIQGGIAAAYRLFMSDVVGAVEYFGPNLVGASSEGGSELFTVDYFGHTAALAQSSQLYKQVMVGVHERVFALMPFFRAEPSQTSRHLTEGKQFEFEMGFFDDWKEILDVQESCLKFIVSYLHEHYGKEMSYLDHPIVEAPSEVAFPRLTFAEAQELFYQRSSIDERQELDLSPAAERELCRYAKEEFNTDFLFVTDWKREKRPFYAYPKDDNPELTNTHDLLCAGLEISSGGQRCHTYSSIIDGLQRKGMDPQGFVDYLEIFKYGMPPHGGFGMGLERLTMTLFRLSNIREATLFPSDPKRIASCRIKAQLFFGAENLRNEIIRRLRERDLPFRHLVHQSSLTREEISSLRKVPEERFIKALILRGKKTKKNYQFNILSLMKLDMKAVADLVGEKCEFESPAVIMERFGLSIGAIPPFGLLLGLPTFFDQKIATLGGECAFNCGLTTESIAMKAQELIAIVEPTMGTFATP